MLSAPELLEFLEDQGEEGATLARAQQLIQTYELNETGGGRHGQVVAPDRAVFPAEWVLLRAGCGHCLGQVSLPPPDSASTCVKWHNSVPSSQGLVEG